MIRMTVEQAAQTALQTYLQSEMDAFFTGPDRCIVSDRWPEPGQGLPVRAISILPAGARQDTNVQETDIARSDFPDGVTGLYTWRVACVTQPLQLDIWSCYSAARDELCAIVGDSLRKGERYTLNKPNGFPTRDGIILAMNPANGGYTGFAAYSFDGSAKADSDRSVNVREYRSSIQGSVDVDLTVQARAPRLARALIKMALNPKPGAAFMPDLTFTMTTATGEVAVTGT